MKFSDLKENDLEYIKMIYYSDKHEGGYTHREKMDILSKKYNVTARTIRRWWKEEMGLSKKYQTLPKDLEEASMFEIDEDTEVIFYTAAQNKTGINRQLLLNMEAYRDFLTEELGLKTQIVVAPTRYRNPTSPQEDFSKEEWWVDEVRPYLSYTDLMFGDVMLASTVRIRPTATNPLTGFDLLAANKSVVFPHPKIHLSSMPRFKGQKLRTMSTTGYLSLKNYSDSKSGYKGEQHHSYGFVVIEKSKNGCYTPRNVKATYDGTFCDVKYSVEEGKVTTIDGVSGMVLGDIHAAELNKELFDITKDIIKEIKPEITVLHDVLDGASINPHETKDMFIKKQKIREGKNNIGLEIEQAVDLISEVSGLGTKVKVIQSNHDVFLDRYVNDFNWKSDLHNSEHYLGLAHIQQTVDLNKYGCIFGYLVKNSCPEVDYVKYGDSLLIEGYECALHGEHGVNGSRGNYKSFARLNFKMILAHTHSPTMYDSVMVVGHTCNKDQYYNRKGISSWQYAHGVIFRNKKNQLWIFDDNYKFTNLL